MEKVCQRCQIRKPLAAFSPNSRMKDGRLNRCRECRKADSRIYYDANAELIRQKAQARRMEPDVAVRNKAWRETPQRRQKAARIMRDYEKRNPIKVAARLAVREVVRKGLMVPLPCEVCGSAKAQAHHGDYSKPLDVRWLCSTHHAEWHKSNTPKWPKQDQAA